jgi:hypothetical protein
MSSLVNPVRQSKPRSSSHMYNGSSSTWGLTGEAGTCFHFAPGVSGCFHDSAAQSRHLEPRSSSESSGANLVQRNAGVRIMLPVEELSKAFDELKQVA